MATADNTTMMNEFHAFGCKFEQLKSSIRVFRHGFQHVEDVDAEACLFGLEAAAESLWEQFGDLESLLAQFGDPPKPRPEI